MLKDFFMNWTDFAQWSFYGLISVIAIYVANTLSKLTDSVQDLNIKFASMLEKSAWHERELVDLGGRVTKLEDK
jgi:hypothetical protein